MFYKKTLLFLLFIFLPLQSGLGQCQNQSTISGSPKSFTFDQKTHRFEVNYCASRSDFPKGNVSIRIDPLNSPSKEVKFNNPSGRSSFVNSLEPSGSLRKNLSFSKIYIDQIKFVGGAERFEFEVCLFKRNEGSFERVACDGTFLVKRPKPKLGVSSGVSKSFALSPSHSGPNKSKITKQYSKNIKLDYTGFHNNERIEIQLSDDFPASWRLEVQIGSRKWQKIEGNKPVVYVPSQTKGTLTISYRITVPVYAESQSQTRILKFGVKK